MPSEPKIPPAASEDDALRRIWSRADALRGLKRVTRVSLQAAKQIIRDDDGAVAEIRFNPSAANAATKAIEAANRLMGYGAPPDDDADTQLVIRFEDTEDFAQ